MARPAEKSPEKSKRPHLGPRKPRRAKVVSKAVGKLVGVAVRKNGGSGPTDVCPDGRPQPHHSRKYSVFLKFGKVGRQRGAEGKNQKMTKTENTTLHITHSRKSIYD